MGNCCSTPTDSGGGAQSQQHAPRPIALQGYPQSRIHQGSINQSAVASHANYQSSTIQTHSVRASSPSSGSAMGTRAMDQVAKRNFLQAVHKGLYDQQYMVIGGCALSEYGNNRATPDVDVLLGGGCSTRSAEDLLLARNPNAFRRFKHKKIG
jgi:hypothetical protein